MDTRLCRVIALNKPKHCTGKLWSYLTQYLESFNTHSKMTKELKISTEAISIILYKQGNDQDMPPSAVRAFSCLYMLYQGVYLFLVLIVWWQPANTQTNIFSLSWHSIYLCNVTPYIGVSPITQLRTCVKIIVTFKGGHSCGKSEFPFHKEMLLKERIRSIWEQILSFKRSSHDE